MDSGLSIIKTDTKKEKKKKKGDKSRLNFTTVILNKHNES